MSTNGVIARKTESGFEGRYHHWDSYPEGLGAALYQMAQKFDDLGIMLALLIDEHPAGWSSIVDADWSLAPGYVTVGGERPLQEVLDDKRPRCYCHGDREEEAEPLFTEEDPSMEFVYIIDKETAVMEVRTYKEQVAVVDLRGPEPDWNALL